MWKCSHIFFSKLINFGFVDDFLSVFAQDRPEQRGLHSMCRFVITNYPNEQHLQQSSEQATSSLIIRTSIIVNKRNSFPGIFAPTAFISRHTLSRRTKRGPEIWKTYTRFHLQFNFIWSIVGSMGDIVMVTSTLTFSWVLNQIFPLTYILV